MTSQFVYALGDDDPTPLAFPPGVDGCQHSCRPVGLCTWPAKHEGQHVAGDGLYVIGVAPQDG